MVNPLKYNRTECSPARGHDGFRSKTEKKWFDNFFKTKKTILPERPIAIFDFPNNVIQLFRNRRWLPQLEHSGGFNETWVRLFFASLVSTGPKEFEAFVRGVRIPVTSGSLAVFMGVPHEENPEPYLDDLNLRPDLDDIATRFTGRPTEWVGDQIAPSTFTKMYRYCNIIFTAAVWPTRHKTVRGDHGTLLYAVADPATRVDFASLIITHMIAAANDTAATASLPFATLVTRLCTAHGCEALASDVLKNAPSPINGTTLARSDAQIQSQRKRARVEAGPSGAQAAAEEEEPVPAPGLVDLHRRFETLSTEQRQQGTEIAGIRSDIRSLRGEFDGFSMSYRRDISMMMRFQADSFRMQYPGADVPDYFRDPYGGAGDFGGAPGFDGAGGSGGYGGSDPYSGSGAPGAFGGASGSGAYGGIGGSDPYGGDEGDDDE